MVSGGGGAPRHKLAVDPSERMFKDAFEGPQRRFFHFCELTVENGVLRMKVVALENGGTFKELDPVEVKADLEEKNGKVPH